MTDITETQAENLYDAMYRAVNDTMPRIHDADVGRWLVGWMEDYGWTVEPPDCWHWTVIPTGDDDE